MSDEYMKLDPAGNSTASAESEWGNGSWPWAYATKKRSRARSPSTAGLSSKGRVRSRAPTYWVWHGDKTTQFLDAAGHMKVAPQDA